MIFIDNKYTRLYFQIITRASNRTLPPEIYKERHHILPKCMGGNNKKSNIVPLTAKEHFICHRLLPKMVNDSEIQSKLLFASWAMASAKPVSKKGERIKCSSSYYSILREHVAVANRLRQIGVPPGNKGVPQTEERRQKTRDVTPVICEHCNKSIKPWIYSRFHGDKCKLLTDFVGPMPKRKKRSSNHKTFKAVDPQGLMSIGKNLKQFCHDNNLSYAQCRRCAVGTYTNFKGWTFQFQ